MIILMMPKMTCEKLSMTLKNQLAFAAQTVERKTKQYGKQQHLQNVYRWQMRQ